MNNFLYSIITFVVALFFGLIGIICVLIPWSDDIRNILIQFILEDSLAISLFGFVFIIVSAAIIAYILVNARKQHYHLKTGVNVVSIDESVINQYLTGYWKQLFPKDDVACRVVIKKNIINVSVELPFLPVLEQRGLLERIQRELQDLLAFKLSYSNVFHLYASFQEPNPPKTIS